MANLYPFTSSERLIALIYGVIAHSIFVIAVLTMIAALFSGLQIGYGVLTGFSRFLANTLLLLQFPLLHSLLLSTPGRPILNLFAPQRIARYLQPTTYVIIASLQILVVFLCWSPDNQVLWMPRGWVYFLHLISFITAWILLGKSMSDAHLGIQTGYIGWLSVWQNKSEITWPGLAVNGLYRICRHPIYFSFMLTLWTAPIWTYDKIYLALAWSLYCLTGPLLKERRFEKIFGNEFRDFKKRIPYWPMFNRSRKLQ